MKLKIGNAVVELKIIHFDFNASNVNEINQALQLMEIGNVLFAKILIGPKGLNAIVVKKENKNIVRSIMINVSVRIVSNLF